jgi:hypothetical protein
MFYTEDPLFQLTLKGSIISNLADCYSLHVMEVSGMLCTYMACIIYFTRVVFLVNYISCT